MAISPNITSTLAHNIENTTPTVSLRSFDKIVKYDTVQSAIVDNPSNKPLLILASSKHCPACKKLKAQIGKDPQFDQLLNEYQFVVLEGSSRAQAKYIPGSYVPRFAVASPLGEVDLDLKPSNAPHKYPHLASSTKALVKVMLDGLERF